MFVSHNMLWMDFSAAGMFTEGYCLVRWREWGHRCEKTELVRGLNVEEVAWKVKYQLRKPECELQFCFFEALTVRNGIGCMCVQMCGCFIQTC